MVEHVGRKEVVGGMEFNHADRRGNIVRTSAAAAVCNVLSLALGFVYRMLFLRVLTVQYLGINSLFTNVLGLLSLADLGIADAIVYRLYAPISVDDIESVGRLMRFFRKAYHAIGAVIMILGLCITPFVELFVRDASDVPAGVNLHVVFVLFVAQSASSYLFSYKLALLSADQRNHVTLAIRTGIDFFRYGIQVILLFMTRDYILTLMAGIVVTIMLNWCSSIWVTRQYAPVFEVTEDISPDERTHIFSDTFAALLHKVGGVVLNATDSILLSRFIGLAVTGVYSNYQLIASGVNRLVYMLFSSFTSSMGNANVELSSSDRYAFYRKAMFANFAFAGAFCSCMYTLTDDFIVIWLGEGVLLDNLTLTWLCIQTYVLGVRQVSMSFITASGLFVKDRLRPLIEASLNLLVSVVALHFMGVVGVVIGTVVSCCLTAVWREQYLLHRYVFDVRVWRYWRDYALHVAVTVAAGGLLYGLRWHVAGPRIGLLTWLALGLAGVLIYGVVFSLAFCRTDEYRYYVGLVRNIVCRGR